MARDARARQTRNKACQAAARAVGQTQNVDRSLHGAGRDVDDAAKTARCHTIHHGLDQLNGGEHVGIHSLDPSIAVPVAKIAGGGATCIGHQHVKRNAGATRHAKHRLSPGRRGDVAGHRQHLRRLFTASADCISADSSQLRSRFLQGGIATRIDDHVHTFLHQGLGTAIAQTLAGAAHQRPLARDS